MPISAESAARSSVPTNEPVVDAAVAPPSQTVKPTMIDEEPQQAATAPGSGSEVHTSILPAPSWKEQVQAYAKKGRGTVLRKPELKEHGDKILEGKATVADINERPNKS